MMHSDWFICWAGLMNSDVLADIYRGVTYQTVEEPTPFRTGIRHSDLAHRRLLMN